MQLSFTDKNIQFRVNIDVQKMKTCLTSHRLPLNQRRVGSHLFVYSVSPLHCYSSSVLTFGETLQRMYDWFKPFSQNAGLSTAIVPRVIKVHLYGLAGLNKHMLNLGFTWR